MSLSLRQGDQIGRVFAHFTNSVIFFLWVVFLNITELVHIFGLLFSLVKFMYPLFLTQWVGLHFGRFFSQTLSSTYLHSMRMSTNETLDFVTEKIIFNHVTANRFTFTK
jgi:hypothetical protein